MTSNKGLTLKDYNWINSKCRSIAKLEAHGIADKFISNELYVLGVFAFRQFHKAGMQADILHPSLTYQPQPKELEAVWTNTYHLNMNILVRIQGYVTDAHVLEPYAKHFLETKRYELHLCPSDCTHFYDLEHRVEELKREHEQHQSYDAQRFSNHDTCLALKDRVFAGDCLKFESLNSPRLEGDFSRLAYDEELIGKYVQIVGRLQIAEIGICFLSFHILEPAVHPAHGWDN